MARRLGIALALVTAAGLAIAAYWLLFTTLMAYDDEGYVLVSLKNYSAHGGLYAQVYSQYGPFFYLLHDIGTASSGTSSPTPRDGSSRSSAGWARWAPARRWCGGRRVPSRGRASRRAWCFFTFT